MVIIGFDNKETNSPTDNYGNLTSGVLQSTKYLTDQREDAKISIYVKTSDTFDNISDIDSEATGEELIKKSEIKITRDGNDHPFTIEKVKNAHYNISFETKKPGLYKIHNEKFPNGSYYKATVYAGYPSNKNSNCKIQNDLSLGTIDTGVYVDYECTLYDQFRNPVNVEFFERYAAMRFMGIYFINDSRNVYGTYSRKDNKKIFKFKTTKNGLYKVHLKYKFDNSNMKYNDEYQSLPDTVNEFRVVTTPKSLKFAQFYLFNEKKFSDNYEDTLFYSNNDNLPFTLLNLSDGQGNFSAEVGYGSGFDIKDFSGYIKNEHNPDINPLNKLKFDFFKFSKGSETYISVSNPDFNNKLEKNSWFYYLTIKYRSSEITLNIRLRETCRYACCGHPISYPKTLFTPLKSRDENIIENNELTKLGLVMLRTNDEYFYNKKVDINKFTYELNPPTETTKIIFKEISDQHYDEGLYYAYAKGIKSEDYTLNFKLFDTTYYSKFRFFIKPVYKIYTVKNKGEYKTISDNDTNMVLKDDDCDQYPRHFIFEAFDVHGNILSNTLSDENNYYSLKVKVTIDEEEIINDFSTQKIGLKHAVHHELWEFLKIPGNYVIEVIGSNNQLKYSYYRRPGKPSEKTSFATMNTGNSLKVKENVSISLNLKDQHSNLISKDKAYFKEELKKINVYALHEDKKTKVKLNQEDSIPNHLIYEASINDKTGKYAIFIEYEDAETLIPCQDCQFEVNYETFDINKCKLFIVLSKPEEMLTTSITNINNSVDVPLFNFYFYDSDGIQLNKVDNSSNLKAFITGVNDFKLDLTREWVKSYQIIWSTIEDNVAEDRKLKNLKADDYTLNISYNDKIALRYPLKLLGDGNDDDAGNGPADLTKTFFSEHSIKLEAGITYTISVMFRTKENLRVNFYEDPKEFDFEVNVGASDKTKFNIFAQKGPKKGTYIISINSTKQYTKGIIFNTFLKKTKIPQDVTMFIKHTDMKFISILSESIKKDTELNDAQVENPSLVKMQAYDKYNNIFYELYDNNYSLQRITNLFTADHENKEEVLIKAIKDNIDKTYFSLEIISRKVGKVELKSNIFEDGKVFSKFFAIGKFDPNVSFGELSPFSLTAGGEFTYKLNLRDKYNNLFDNSNFDFEKNKITNHYTIDSGKEYKVEWKKSTNKNQIESSIKATIANVNGSYEFYSKLNSSDKIKCENCLGNVKVNTYKFENSRVSYLLEGEDIPYKDKKFEITKTYMPIFKMTFYDEYDNFINKKPEDKEFKISLIQEDGKVAINFCYEKEMGFVRIIICKNEKAMSNWEFLLNGNYKLQIENISANKDVNNLNKIYNVVVKDGKKDDNASNAEVDLNKTAFSKTKVYTIAGEEGRFPIEIRTIDNKRKYAWVKKPEEFIKITQPIKNPEISYTVKYGEVPGKYEVKVISLKSIHAKDNFYLNVNVGGLVFYNKIQIITDHNIANSVKFVNSKDEEYKNLPEGNADDRYNIFVRIYDKYLNIVDPLKANIHFSVIPPKDKEGKNISFKSVHFADFKSSYSIKAIYTGTYTIKTSYSEDVEFNITYGIPFFKNSLAIADMNVVAGNNVKLYVVPYDKNNNLIDANKMPSDDRFTATLNYPNGNKDLGKLTAIEEKTFKNYPINNNKKVSAFVIQEKLIHRGENIFQSFLNKNQIKCINCSTQVTSSDKILSNFLFTYFDSKSASFKELVNYTNFDNANSEPIIRIFPRDQFSNKIDTITNFSNYSLTFTEKKNNNIIYKFRVSNNDDGKQEFIEFKINDNVEVNKDLTYSTLTKGEYILTISELTLNKKFDVNLFGREGDKDAGNDKVDITKTVISSSDLEFVAGTTGYIILELRTESNKRKNNWFYEVDVKPYNNDESFTKVVKHATKLGQYLITFGSTKSNTFPKPYDYKLRVFVGETEVTNLNVLLQIKPAKMEKAVIIEKYLENENTIKKGNCDNNLIFEVQARDEYDNLTIVNPNELRLSVISPIGTLLHALNGVENFETLQYTVETKIYGTYSIRGNKIPSYTYFSSPGRLSVEKSIVNLITKEINAGEKARLIIYLRDKYHNKIQAKDLDRIFNVSIKTPSDNKVNCKKVYRKDDTFLIFQETLNQKGENTWNILIDDDTKSCDFCITNVLSSISYPKNSEIYLYDHVNQSNTKIDKNTHIFALNTKPIIIFVTLKDEYGNIIDKISENIDVKDATLSGNNMKIIDLISENSKDNSQIKITIPRASINNYNHIVAGKNYLLKFTLFDKNDSKIPSEKYTFPVDMSSEKDSDGYGNGDYVVENTFISKKEINMYADNTSTFIMRLKTKDNLFYFGNINTLTDIKHSLSVNDKTFTLKVDADVNRYNYYTVTIYSKESSKEIKNLTIRIIDPKTKAFKDVPGKIAITVNPKMPPHPPSTIILKRPTDKFILPNKLITITFNLFDEYGNKYHNNYEVLDRMALINNDFDVSEDSNSQFNKQLQNDGFTYEFNFMPSYPPKKVSFYVEYNDKKLKILQNVLNEVIEKPIVTEPDFANTQVFGENINLITAGEKLDLNVKLRDFKKICVDFQGDLEITANVRGPINSENIKTITYNFEKIVLEDKTLECRNFYKAKIPNDKIYTEAGDYEIILFIGDNKYRLDPIQQKMSPGEIDFNNSLSILDEDSPNIRKLTAGDKVQFTVEGRDKYNNKIVEDNKFSFKLKDLKDGNLEKDDYTLNSLDEKMGEYRGFLNVYKSGLYKLEYYYDGKLVVINTSRGVDEFEVIPNICVKYKYIPKKKENKEEDNPDDEEKNKEYIDVDFSNLSNTIVGKQTILKIKCYDKYRNKVKVGGEKFDVNIQVSENDNKTNVPKKLKDELNGNYIVEFVPPLQGNYDIVINLRQKEYFSTSKKINNNKCEKEKPISCSNKDKCVNDMKDCMDECTIEKPIYCEVNGKLSCNKSSKECDCPKNVKDPSDPYVKCDYIDVCVLTSKKSSMCYDPWFIDCRRFNEFRIFNKDGICRSREEIPARRVCPLGYHLCTDLTCRKDISECEVYEDCPYDEIRCPDMSCVKDQKDCPSRITCPFANQVACPDGECVENEVYCKTLPTCNEGTEFLCSQNVCSFDKSTCPKFISCGHGRSLCKDMVCRFTCRED